MRHPLDMDGTDIEGFLTMLATERRVAASRHNQAFSVLLFYREVLAVDLPWLDNIEWPSTPKRTPYVLTTTDRHLVVRPPIRDVIDCTPAIGTGMRSIKFLQLPIKDIDFDR